MAKVSKAYEQVFGGVNAGTFSRRSSDLKRPIRQGKTARDKANGHVPGKVNRRVLDISAPMLPGCNRRAHIFIKA